MENTILIIINNISFYLFHFWHEHCLYDDIYVDTDLVIFELIVLC